MNMENMDSNENRSIIQQLFGLGDDDSLMNDDDDSQHDDDVFTVDGETRNDWNVEECPKPYMVFHSVSNLFYRYNEYAKLKGFSVAKK